jgi:hypothetical protein
MKTLSMTEIEQVNGAGLFELVNVCAGGLIGAAAMTQIGAVTIAGVAVAAPYVVAAGAVLGASFGFAISQSASQSAQRAPYYYY